MTARVGPRMRDVVAYVTTHPGCYPADAAREVGPHGSTCYGYRTVKRAVSAGLVVQRPDPNHRGRSRLYLPGDGT